MFYLIIKIMNIDYKEDVILALQSVGLNHGSFYEATNLDPSLSLDLPMFTGLFRTEEDKARKALIITTLMDEKKQAVSLLQNLREAGIDIDNENILRVIVLPVSMMFDQEHGFMEFK